MALLEEYFVQQKHYVEKYGDRTLLMYQVGTFYEMYASEDYSVPLAIAELLDLRVTLRNSSNRVNAGTEKNPYLIGIPCVSYEKYYSIILNNNYTIIRYDQVKGNSTQRVPSQIVSPLTSTDIPIKSESRFSNQICVIYIEFLNNKPKIENISMLVGISSIDILTGASEVQELYTNETDSRCVINTLYRLLTANKPKEVQLFINLTDPKVNKQDIEKYVFDSLELGSYPIINISFEINKHYLTTSYHRECLTHVFHPTEVKSNNQGNQAGLSGMIIKINKGAILDIFTELGLERLTYGTSSYVLLLQYCYEHSESLIKKVRKPRVNQLNSENSLELTYNAIVQLGLIPSNLTKVNYRINKKKNYDTVLSVLDNTDTPMGKRGIRHRLLNPITDESKLNKMYDAIGFLRDNLELTTKLSSILTELYDIEKLNLKLTKGTITPKEFYNLFTSYSSIVTLINELVPYLSKPVKSEDPGKREPSELYYIFPVNKTLQDFNMAMKDVYSTFDFNILKDCTIIDKELHCRDSPLLPGKSKEITETKKDLDFLTQHLAIICHHIQSVMGGPGTIEAKSFSKKVKKGKSIKDDEDEEIFSMVDLGIYITGAQLTKLKKNMDQIDTQFCGVLKPESKHSKYAIRSDVIDIVCNSILVDRNKIARIALEFYNKYLDYFNENYDLSGIVEFITELDILISNAKTSLKFGYSRPEIIPSTDDDPAYLEVKDLRHPLVERIINTEYITNDSTLDGNGILLYGCNSTGKSVYTLSNPIAVIMAQSGMWTAGKIKYRIFKRIITRLSGQDDLLKGHSSFVVEMLELRTILRNANNRTLVVGDELCRGTESLSGSALVISTLEYLSGLRCAYIFSTHLHDIPNNKRIIELLNKKSLQIFHLETSYDTSTGTLVYNRKLRSGPGESIYGLEVAKSLDISPDFIKHAMDIRKELLGESLEMVGSKKNRYNGEFVLRCQICKSNENVHTHHIKEQSLADSNGLIGHLPKNAECNTINLCQFHHEELHKNGMHFEPVSTADGTILNIIKNEK